MVETGEAKQWKKEKKNNPALKKKKKKNFTPVKFRCHDFKRATQKHAGWYEICNKAAAGGRPTVVLSRCQSRFTEFNSSQGLYRSRGCSETVLPYQQSEAGFMLTNRFFFLIHRFNVHMCSLMATADEARIKLRCLLSDVKSESVLCASITSSSVHFKF